MGKEYLHWNIRGLNDKNRRKGKVDKVISLIQNPKKIVLLNLQETHISTREDIPKTFFEYKHIFNIVSSLATPADKGSGIILLVNKSEEITSQIEILKGRILILSLKNNATGNFTTVISFYGKSTNKRFTWESQMNNIKIILNQTTYKTLYG